MIGGFWLYKLLMKEIYTFYRLIIYFACARPFICLFWSYLPCLLVIFFPSKPRWTEMNLGLSPHCREVSHLAKWFTHIFFSFPSIVGFWEKNSNLKYFVHVSLQLLIHFELDNISRKLSALVKNNRGLFMKSCSAKFPWRLRYEGMWVLALYFFTSFFWIVGANHIAI